MIEVEPEEELALIQRAAKGDHEAFRHLVMIYEGQLLAYLTRMLGDSESARDVAQEAFITIFHTLPQWQIPDRVPRPAPSRNVGKEGPPKQLLAPWLYRIAINQAISVLRKRQVRQRIHVPSWRSSEDETDIAAQSTAPLEDSFEERYIARSLLQQALQQLSELDAACIVLHYVNGERYQEIAERLGLSSGAVRKRVARALPVLRQIYQTMDTEVRP